METLMGFIGYTLIGFVWGQSWAERKRPEKKVDAGVELLASMIESIQDKRRFVAPETKAICSRTFTLQDQEYRLSIETVHDWEGRQ